MLKGKLSCACPKGLAEQGVEIIDRYDTNTYVMYTTCKFSNVIYVLHAFQKKSKSGIATPLKDIELIRRRLAEAQRLNRQRSN